MPTDVRDVLREVAGRPAEPIDTESIWRRARRQRAAYGGGALLSVVALVVAAAFAVPNLLERPGVDLVDPPPERPVATWQTIVVGEAQLSVPPHWRVVDLRESPGTFGCDGLSNAGDAETLFTYQPLEPAVPKCGPPVPDASPPEGLRLHAYPIAMRESAGAHVDREINGHGVQVIEEYATTQFRFSSLGLAVRVSSSGDRGLVERILATVGPAQTPAPSDVSPSDTPADGTEWRTVDLGEATLSVPSTWAIVDFEEELGAICTMFVAGPTLYVGVEPQIPVPCPTPPDPQQSVGVHARSLSAAPVDELLGDQVVINGIEGECRDMPDERRHCHFEEVDLLLYFSTADDPELADEVLHTLQRDGAEDGSSPAAEELREVDLGEATITIPTSWEVIDLRDDITAICSRFLGDPTLYLWNHEPPPSCPAPNPDAPRSVGVHVTRREAPFSASRGGEGDAVISIQSGPTLYEHDNGDGTRTYRVDGSTLELHVSYDPDPELARRVVFSLRFDEAE